MLRSFHFHLFIFCTPRYILEFMRILLSSIILLFIFQSCSLTNGDKDVIVRIDDEFIIDMHETLGNSRLLVFEIESVENQPCLNSGIENSITVKNNQLSLFINGIEQVSDCNPGEAPASETSSAGVIQNRTYDLYITLRNTIENVGKFIVNADSYTFSIPSTNGIILRHEVLNRIPNQFIWGYVAFDDPNLVGDSPTDFISSIASYCQPKTMNTGYFGQFNIDETSQELSLTTSPSKNYVKTFFYKFTGEKEDLEQVLEAFRSGTEGANLELVVFTSDGEIL